MFSIFRKDKKPNKPTQRLNDEDAKQALSPFATSPGSNRETDFLPINLNLANPEASTAERDASGESPIDDIVTPSAFTPIEVKDYTALPTDVTPLDILNEIVPVSDVPAIEDELAIEQPINESDSVLDHLVILDKLELDGTLNTQVPSLENEVTTLIEDGAPLVPELSTTILGAVDESALVDTTQILDNQPSLGDTAMAEADSDLDNQELKSFTILELSTEELAVLDDLTQTSDSEQEDEELASDFEVETEAAQALPASEDSLMPYLNFIAQEALAVETIEAVTPEELVEEPELDVPRPAIQSDFPGFIEFSIPVDFVLEPVPSPFEAPRQPIKSSFSGFIAFAIPLDVFEFPQIDEVEGVEDIAAVSLVEPSPLDAPRQPITSTFPGFIAFTIPTDVMEVQATVEPEHEVDTKDLDYNTDLISIEPSPLDSPRPDVGNDYSGYISFHIPSDTVVEIQENEIQESTIYDHNMEVHDAIAPINEDSAPTIVETTLAPEHQAALEAGIPLPEDEAEHLRADAIGASIDLHEAMLAFLFSGEKPSGPDVPQSEIDNLIEDYPQEIDTFVSEGLESDISLAHFEAYPTATETLNENPNTEALDEFAAVEDVVNFKALPAEAAWNEDVATAVLNESIDAGTTIFTVTEQVQASNPFETFPNWLKEVFDQSSRHLFLLNRQGAIVQAAGYNQLLSGYDADAVMGKPFLAFIQPDDQEAVNLAIDRCLRSGHSQTLAYKAWWFGREFVDLQAVFHHAYWSGHHFVLVAELPLHADWLGQIQQRDRVQNALLEALQQAIVVTDLNSQQVTVNPVAKRLFHNYSLHNQLSALHYGLAAFEEVQDSLNRISVEPSITLSFNVQLEGVPWTCYTQPIWKDGQLINRLWVFDRVPDPVIIKEQVEVPYYIDRVVEVPTEPTPIQLLASNIAFIVAEAKNLDELVKPTLSRIQTATRSKRVAIFALDDNELPDVIYQTKGSDGTNQFVPDDELHEELALTEEQLNLGQRVQFIYAIDQVAETGMQAWLLSYGIKACAIIPFNAADQSLFLLIDTGAEVYSWTEAYQTNLQKCAQLLAMGMGMVSGIKQEKSSVNKPLPALANKGLVLLWNWDLVEDKLEWQTQFGDIQELQADFFERFISMERLITEGMPAEHRQSTILAIQDWIDSGVSQLNLELPILGANGHPLIFQFSGTLLKDPATQTAIANGLAYDLTDVKQQLLTLSSLETERSQELAVDRVKFETFSEAALPTLAQMMAFADLIEDQASTANEQKYAAQIRSQSRKLLRLLSNLGDTGQNLAAASMLVKANVQTLCEELLADFALEAEAKQVQLRLELSEHLPEIVSLHEASLYQWLYTVISLGIKRLHHGYLRMLVAAQLEQDQTYTITFLIEDSGSGYSLAELAQVLPALTTDNEAYEEQQGLQSKVARSLPIHNGNILVISNLDLGSRFLITLQKVQDEANEQARSQDEINKLLDTSFAPAKLLLLFDDPVNAQVAEGYLDGRNLNLSKAVNVPQALAFLQRHSFDILICDSEFLEGNHPSSKDLINWIATYSGMQLLPVGGTAEAALPLPIEKLNLLSALRRFLPVVAEQKRTLAPAVKRALPTEEPAVEETQNTLSEVVLLDEDGEAKMIPLHPVPPTVTSATISAEVEEASQTEEVERPHYVHEAIPVSTKKELTDEESEAVESAGIWTTEYLRQRFFQGRDPFKPRPTPYEIISSQKLTTPGDTPAYLQEQELTQEPASKPVVQEPKLPALEEIEKAKPRVKPVESTVAVPKIDEPKVPETKQIQPEPNRIEEKVAAKLEASVLDAPEAIVEAMVSKLPLGEGPAVESSMASESTEPGSSLRGITPERASEAGKLTPEQIEALRNRVRGESQQNLSPSRLQELVSNQEEIMKRKIDSAAVFVSGDSQTQAEQAAERKKILESADLKPKPISDPDIEAKAIQKTIEEAINHTKTAEDVPTTNLLTRFKQRQTAAKNHDNIGAYLEDKYYEPWQECFRLYNSYRIQRFAEALMNDPKLAKVEPVQKYAANLYNAVEYADWDKVPVQLGAFNKLLEDIKDAA